jgi:hypothetical protein
MKVNSYYIIFLLLISWPFVYSQKMVVPKKLFVNGEYVHKQTSMPFPELIDIYQRFSVVTFNKENTGITVTYEHLPSRSKISISVYPAGDGCEGRLRGEYQESLQSITRTSKRGIHVRQFPVQHGDTGYICNGYEAMIYDDFYCFNSLTVYECGRWFMKVRITANDLDSLGYEFLEEQIYKHFDPTKLTATNPLNPLADVYLAKNACQDSVMLGSALGSAYKKIDWADANVNKNERASGFPDLYIDMHIEALKAFMEFQHREKFQSTLKTDFTKRYLAELKMIDDAGFLAEFVMDQYGMILIIPDKLKIDYDSYLKWKQNHKLTIDLHKAFYVVAYGQK